MARKPKLGKHMRWTPSGRISLQFSVDGARISQAKILPSEPASYATPKEAQAGVERVLAHLAQQVDRAATVQGFYARWTNEDDTEWGIYGTECPRRGEHAIHTYASKVRGFADVHGERTLASISEIDIKAWQHHERYAASGMTAISTFLKDAATAGLRSEINPAKGPANKAEKQLAKKRERKGGKGERPPVPDHEVIEAMLEHARNPRYPRSFFAWLLTGVRTGMRASEIDGMEWEHLDGDVYRIDWQLHAVTNLLDEPKHNSRRAVVLPADVLAEIERERGSELRTRYLWTNSRLDPWRNDSRDKWWTKVVDGISLAQITGCTMYEATRHYWAGWAVNEGGMSPYRASVLMGHSDGGALLIRVYARQNEDLALHEMREAQQRKVIDIRTRRTA